MTETVEKANYTIAICHPCAKQPLATAIRRYNLPLVKLLFLHGADVNALSLVAGHDSKSFELPLCIAADTGQVDIVKYLLERDVKVNEADSKFNTPLHYVVDKISDFAADISNPNDSHQIIFD